MQVTYICTVKKYPRYVILCIDVFGILYYLGFVPKRSVRETISFYNAASEPKELYEVPGATHVSLYDIDKDVDQAVAKMDEFFKKYSK